MPNFPGVKEFPSVFLVISPGFAFFLDTLNKSGWQAQPIIPQTPGLREVFEAAIIINRSINLRSEAWERALSFGSF
jgi:hypothetical protein